MLIVALALQAVQPPPADNGWARFSAHQARSRIAVDVAIGTTRSASGRLVYWVRRTTKRPGQWAEVSRTDSLRCPAVLTMLRSMRDLPAPRPAPPLLDNAEIVSTRDGTGYELHAPAAYPGMSEAEITLSSNIGTPLADWVERSLAALRPCLPPVL